MAKSEEAHFVAVHFTDELPEIALSPDDLEILATRHLSGLAPPSEALFEIKGHALVTSRGQHYYRVNIRYTDPASFDITHGSCWQDIVVWLNTDLTFFRAHAREVLCPI